MANKNSAVKAPSVARALGLKEETRQSSVKILTTSLAATFMLYTKTYKFHWNVTGMDFQQLHELFEHQYEQLAEAVDALGERILQLGSPAIGTLAEMQESSFLKEAPGVNPDARGMVAELLADHENVVRHLREAVDTTTESGDTGTADFLTGLMEEHEKQAWFLRAHLGPADD